ncbi:maleylpyruvate isomerase family mycothiol-dependent enzyme [Nocardiopsis sp. NPDC006139]|uniref:maleylpyruvate isomerase family mycothiol-dependent enzyme n=1 Tax=Nocardiopsis sp. NPDC006139 TaxID=3154578 RepID=UPI0033BF1A53
MDDHPLLGPEIDVRSLFPAERAALLSLLRSLEPGQWRAEAVPAWSVRDLAAHLLGDDYGRLAGRRDGYREGMAPAPGETVAEFIHRENARWVDGTRRISPAALVDTLELTGRWVADLWRDADPHAPSLGVDWAGVVPAPTWFDCARDFTEYWTHRQQIRLAAGLAADLAPEAAGPVLDTFLRALPHTLRGFGAEPGTRARVVVEGPAGGTWTVVRTGGGWAHDPSPGAPAAATVRLDADTAWRMCTRMIDPGEAAARGVLTGDRELAAACCRIVSILR